VNRSPSPATALQDGGGQGQRCRCMGDPGKGHCGGDQGAHPDQRDGVPALVEDPLAQQGAVECVPAGQRPAEPGQAGYLESAAGPGMGLQGLKRGHIEGAGAAG
jgi:hypothetical protein